MFDKLKMVGLAAAFAVAAPVAALAATISGQIDISGTVNLDTSDFSATGNADLNNPGTVLIATGDFGSFTAPGAAAALNDIDFTAPGAIWAVGGFTFTATAFSDFQDTTTKAFKANGVIAGNGFEKTLGVLTFTSQENGDVVTVSFSSTTTPVPIPAAGLMLATALGGMAFARRRRKAA